MTETPGPDVRDALDRVRAEERANDAAHLAEQLDTDERIVDALAGDEDER